MLNIFLDADKGLAYLACNTDQSHEGIEREASRYETGGLLELNIPTRRQIMAREFGEEKTKALTIRKAEEEQEKLTPAELIVLATDQANLLMDIVAKKQLYQVIAGKKYMTVEGWETIGAFNQTHACTDWVLPVESKGEIVAYEAKVNLIKRGAVVGSAIMSCGLDEFPCLGKEGQAKHKSAKSAAQTWATSKAYRMNYSFVAVLAGYEPTPAEEMTGGESPQPKEHFCPIHNVPFIKKGKMKWWGHTYKDESGATQWCNEEKIAKQPAANVTEVIDEPPIEQLEEAKDYIDLQWLKESLQTLRAKKLQAWTESNLLGYMKTTYKVEANTVLEAVGKLDRSQATHFVRRVQETLDLA